MSTAATISPYEPAERDSLVRDAVTGVATGVVAAGRVLVDSLKHDDRQKQILERYKEEQWNLGSQSGPLNAECSALKTAFAALKPVCATLKLRKAEKFVMSAESLGFKLSSLVAPDKPLESQPQLILTGVTGERLVVKKNKTGRLEVESDSGAAVIKKVVVKHNIDRVEEHFKKNYSELKVEKALNGEIAFVSVETRKNPDGQARITASIKNDGEVVVDVSNIKGKRCEAIIQNLARAVGGECVKTSRKKEYFQVVEERGKVRV